MSQSTERHERPVTRILAMLELLQANPRIGGRDLAVRLGVDERTVRRYAGSLAELGIPVVAERGRYGGYRLMPGFKLPPLMLTDGEATAVVLGLLAGRRLGLPSESTESALAKIERVLPATLRENISALRSTLGFVMPSREGAAPATPVALTLAAAAHNRQRVRISYRSWRGDESERDLDPYGLVFHSGRWYVSGLDHRSGEVRTFRADRVVTAQPRPEHFEPPEDADPVAHVVSSLAAVPYAYEVEVVLETTMSAASRRIPATVGKLTETADGILLRTRAEHLDGMAQMLAGFGWPFTIRRPDELREYVRKLSDRIAGYAAR